MAFGELLRFSFRDKIRRIEGLVSEVDFIADDKHHRISGNCSNFFIPLLITPFPTFLTTLLYESRSTTEKVTMKISALL